MLRPARIAIAAAIPMAFCLWRLPGWAALTKLISAVGMVALPFAIIGVTVFLKRNLSQETHSEIIRLSREVHGRRMGRDGRG